VLFIGSLLYTLAAVLQLLQGAPSPRGRAGLVAQLAGALLFNLDTFEAMRAGLDASEETRLVWTPDAAGSICFLAAAVLAFAALRERHRRPRARPLAAANLLGAAAFLAAAVASYVSPNGGPLDPAVARALTSLGALGFLVAAGLLLSEGPPGD
jgi:hypothetical protein